MTNRPTKSPFAALCFSWILFSLVCLILGHLLPLPLPLPPPLPGLAAAVPALGAFLTFWRRDGVRLAGHAVPSASGWWLGLLASLILGGGYAICALPFPENYWMSPLPQVVDATLYGMLPYSVVLGVSWRWAAEFEKSLWWLMSAVVLVCQLLWASTLGLQILFLIYYPAFEDARASASDEFRRNVELGPWTFSAVGHSHDEHTGWRYFVAERCSRGGAATMCFTRNGGSGFYHAETGAPTPSLNQSAEARLFGGWRWYVDD